MAQPCNPDELASEIVEISVLVAVRDRRGRRRRSCHRNRE
ncbi:hypothetical protein MINT15_26050 [Saccharomonospora viridis]|uniref:Uncharacterized protein n=1 Tax=Saccharomonospora viridis TaxID=1852 RepID=A0A837D3T0_9PSEU|nr:hypothetical protein MINT15_26050 [Saccharomonospora viridis]